MSNNCFVYPLIITTLSILIGLLLLTNSETLKYGETSLCIGAGGITFYIIYYLFKYIIGKFKKPKPVSVEFHRFPSRNINMDAISTDSDVVLFDITDSVKHKTVRFNTPEENIYKFIQPVQSIQPLKTPKRSTIKNNDPFNLNDISNDISFDISSDISDDYDEIMLDINKNKNKVNIISSNSSII